MAVKKDDLDKVREGLALCMVLTTCADGKGTPEEIREMTSITMDEPEFREGDGVADAFLNVADGAKVDAKKLLDKVRKLLSTREQRLRGLQLVSRVRTADVSFTEDDRNLLERMAEDLGLTLDDVDDCLYGAQRRRARFLMIYLVYLTAMKDGMVRPQEFESMIPLVLTQPIFNGVGTEDFAALSHSVRRHMDMAKLSPGAHPPAMEQSAAMLVNIAKSLDDETLGEQALKVIARGLFADGEAHPSDRGFFLKIAHKFKLLDQAAHRVMDDAINDARQRAKN
ncbi:hypothetical protein BH09SUM1_BH09SUM1_26140 [soil metagenome]